MDKKYSLTGLDYWRLADEYSVIDACFLTLNLDPGNFEFEDPSKPSESAIIQLGEHTDDESRALWNGDIERVTLHPAQFRAVFKSIGSAILSNKIRANIVKKGRGPELCKYSDGYYEAGANEGEDEVLYGFAISRGTPTIFSNSKTMHNVVGIPKELRKLYVLVEPDWHETTISLDELKRWFALRGIAPAFFFPDGRIDDFRQKEHPRYSAKLATAIAAWESVTHATRNKSVKQSLADWIVSNGIRFGLGNDDGIVSATVAEEVAKISNWKTSGGANPSGGDHVTSGEDVNEIREIQNFEQVIDEDEIPF